MTDYIDRQAAIDRINKQREHLEPDVYPQDKIGDAAYRICAEFIERLPSAQPEIIRCKDCKYSSPNTVYGCRIEPFSYIDDGVRMYSDDYCSRGDKK